MDINAAGGSDLGLTHSTFVALGNYVVSDLFSTEEKTALAYADAMTLQGTVPDDLFARVHNCFDDDQIVELTATIAWENCSARFNRALQISSSGLYKGGPLSWVTPSDW